MFHLNLENMFFVLFHMHATVNVSENIYIPPQFPTRHTLIILDTASLSGSVTLGDRVVKFIHMFLCGRVLTEILCAVSKV